MTGPMSHKTMKVVPRRHATIWLLGRSLPSHGTETEEQDKSNKMRRLFRLLICRI